MLDLAYASIVLTAAFPFAAAIATGGLALLQDKRLPESVVRAVSNLGLIGSFLASLTVMLAWSGAFGTRLIGTVDYGSWLQLGSYRIPAVAHIDLTAVVLSLLGAVLTWLVCRFSYTYLHREPGFARFFILLMMFASGLQLIAFAGALDLFFAGWELLGISSAFFIGFFHERDEPVRSSVRAFTTYRLCDAGFLIALVSVHELLGSTTFEALDSANTLPMWEVSIIALLFLLAAMGKSAMLPFSGWLPRAMEGPTPSSALFYGALSIHMGLFLLLRIWSLFEVSIPVRALAVVIGVATAVYGAAVAKVHTDAKGALAHATLSQVGIILAEIAMGFTTLAVIHIAGHAMLRLFQYLRAPNTIHDAHRLGYGASHSHEENLNEPSDFERKSYLSALHRLRIEDALDAAVAPVISFARVLNRVETGLRKVASVGER